MNACIGKNSSKNSKQNNHPDELDRLKHASKPEKNPSKVKERDLSMSSSSKKEKKRAKSRKRKEMAHVIEIEGSISTNYVKKDDASM